MFQSMPDAVLQFIGVYGILVALAIAAVVCGFYYFRDKD